jgi:hypothetical protein
MTRDRATTRTPHAPRATHGQSGDPDAFAAKLRDVLEER